MNKEDIIANKTLNETMNQPAPNYDLKPTFGTCSQCGTFHPPLAEGVKCPIAPIKTVDNKEVNINNFLTMLKNIIESQVSIKKIKDPEKLIKKLIVETTRFVENYKE